MQFDIVIVGAGPVGIFSAFQAGLLGMKACVIDALDSPGGQCAALYPEKPIYDIPGYPKVLAQELVEQLLSQAKPFAPNYLMSRQVVSIQSAENGFFTTTSKQDIINSKCVLIAAGAGAFGPNRPPLPNIQSYEGTSIFYLVSKREVFAGKKVVIAGGGDSAVDWAISLSEIAKVSVVHRRDKFRAAPSSVAKLHSLAADNKLSLVTNWQLADLKGDGKNLSHVILSDLDNNSRTLEADILLPFFGLSQDLGSLQHIGLNIKNHHIIVSHPYFETNIKGIYAIGDVATYEGKLKLILTGFAEAASALHHAYSRVFDGKALHFEYSTSNKHLS